MEEIKKLGFGLMRLPEKNGEIDKAQVFQMTDEFLARGFTYFDTAYVYGGGASEKIVKEALTQRHPREAFTVASKMPVWCVDKKEDVETIFQTQLQRTGLAYFDYYLLHALDRERLPKLKEMGVWDWLLQKKQEGAVRRIGFSFHDTAEVLEDILKAHPEMEFVQLQINYADWEDEKIQSRRCYEIARKYQKPVVIMEPVKGGSLAELTPEIREIFQKADPNKSVASWAVRFAAGLDGVLTVLSGMSDMEQLLDNTGYMENFQPLSQAEQETVAQVQKQLKEIPTIPCTACRYCVDDCPKKINIPELIGVMNRYRLYGNLAGAKDYYKQQTGDGRGGADDCISCGRCMGHCPQHLRIPDIMKDIAKEFGE